MDWLLEFPQLSPDWLLAAKRAIDGSLKALTRSYGAAIEDFFYPLELDPLEEYAFTDPNAASLLAEFRASVLRWAAAPTPWACFLRKKAKKAS